jgi:hypothetical protein
MKRMAMSVPNFAFIVGTRVAFGLGLGLLVGAKIPPERRQRVGRVLLAFGAVTTIPALLTARRGIHRARRQEQFEHGGGFDDRLIGATRFARKGDDMD